MSTITVQQALEEAVARHRAGKLADAESIYRQILTQRPDHPAALHLLGLLSFQSGRPEQALDLISRAIVADPNVPEYYVNLGVTLDKLGDIPRAIDAYQNAAALNPRLPEIHLNLGNSLRKAGRLPEAAAACRRALELRPDYFEAHLNLGNVLQDDRNFDEAIQSFEAALRLRPNSGEAHHNHGNALAKRGRLDDAIDAQRRALQFRTDFPQAANALGVDLRDKSQKSGKASDLEDAISAFRLAISLNPNLAVALVNLGQALTAKAAAEIKAAKLDHAPPTAHEAVEALRKAVAQAPSLPEAHMALGAALVQTNDLEGAVAAFRQATALRPQWAEAFSSLAGALLHRGEYEAAIAGFNQAIVINPDLADAYFGLGLIYGEHTEFLGSAKVHGEFSDYERSVAALRRAASLRPGSVEIATLLANMLCQTGEMDEAMIVFKRVLELDPAYAMGHWNLGLMLLTQGNFENGWLEYEWRWQVKELDMQFNAAAPLWDGSDLAGKRILLVGEQGLGDAIQCVRFIPQVAARGGKIILAVHQELHRLLEGIPPNISPLGKFVDEWVIPTQTIPEYDAFCPLLTLPKVMRTKLETIPNEIPYIFADDALKAQWQARMPTDGRMKIGLAWAGRPRHTNDKRRSIAAAKLAPLADVDNVWFCSLQKGPIAEEGVLPPLEIVDWMSEVSDMADTAALIANLDLVICADTAVAHLAGAMGKQVWVLLPFLPDWRWMLNRTDSPWYPTMRLFRQEKPGDWKTPIENIVQALREAKTK
jgi:tetratricopeptide (TPR) repeat protein